MKVERNADTFRPVVFVEIAGLVMLLFVTAVFTVPASNAAAASETPRDAELQKVMEIVPIRLSTFFEGWRPADVMSAPVFQTLLKRLPESSRDAYENLYDVEMLGISENELKLFVRFTSYRDDFGYVDYYGYDGDVTQAVNGFKSAYAHYGIEKAEIDGMPYWYAVIRRKSGSEPVPSIRPLSTGVLIGGKRDLEASLKNRNQSESPEYARHRDLLNAVVDTKAHVFACYYGDREAVQLMFLETFSPEDTDFAVHGPAEQVLAFGFSEYWGDAVRREEQFRFADNQSAEAMRQYISKNTVRLKKVKLSAFLNQLIGVNKDNRQYFEQSITPDISAAVTDGVLVMTTTFQVKGE